MLNVLFSTLLIFTSFASVCFGQEKLAGKFEYTVFPLDPVELVGGKEVKGDQNISHRHHRFEYYFANETNRKTFAADPEKYEIQMGGSCARMGGLNTGGLPEIYTVYNNKIYLFASKACRTGFLRSPDRLLDRADEKPEGDVRSKQFGKLWLDEVVSAAGAEKLDELTTYHQKSDRKKKYGDREYSVVNELAVQFNSTDFDAYQFSAFDDEGYAKLVRSNKARFVSTGEDLPMHAQQQTELHKMLLRHPLVILRSRNRDDFVAVAHQVEEGASTKYVSIHIDDTTTELGIDIKSNRIVSTRYQGRGPSSAFGEIKCTYSEFKTIEGITLPTKVQTTFDGIEFDDQSIEYDVSINKAIDWSRFE